MALREIIARFGFQVDSSGLTKAKSGIAGVVSQARVFGAAIAGSVVVRGIANFVDEITTAGDALGKTATQLGLSGKELQAWQTAAGFAGVEATNLNQGFRILGKNALLAQQGSKQAADAFDTLGVSIEDASGNLKPANQLAREAGIALGGLEDRTKAVGLAQQVFGRAGAALLPLFKDGAEGLDAALRKLEEFGGGLSDTLIPLAEESRDRFFEFEIATTSLKSQLAVALLPVLNQLTLGLSKVIAWVSKATAGTSTFKSVAVALGLVLGKLAIAKFGGSLLKLGRAALWPLAKFILLFLVVDDLIALFEGRGSVIGSFIDKIFGPGSAKALIDGIKGVVGALVEGDFEGALKKAADGLEQLGARILKSTGQVPGLTVALFGLAGVFPDLAEKAGEVAGDIGRALDAVGGELRSSLNPFSEAASLLGQAIIDGIIAPIVDGAQAVADAITAVTLGGVKTAKKAIKSKSPSKVTAKQLGEPLVMGIPEGALAMARQAAKQTAGAFTTASALQTAPKALSAPARGGNGAGGALGGIVFKSEIAITVNGGSASDPQIQKLRQGMRTELHDNRRAMLDALTQLVEVPT